MYSTEESTGVVVLYITTWNVCVPQCFAHQDPIEPQDGSTENNRAGESPQTVHGGAGG